MFYAVIVTRNSLLQRKFNTGNSFHDCCVHGTVKLEVIPDFLDNLRSLFENNHQKCNLKFEFLITFIPLRTTYQNFLHDSV